MFDLLFESYTLQIVILGTMMLGAVSGVVGVFSVLRKQALIGDALSHAALPGVVLAFMFTQSKQLYVLLFGAAFASSVSLALLTLIKRYTHIKYDALLAIILSSFFGLGQVLLVYVQNSGNAAQAGLKTFIFGQAATMLIEDVYILMVISLIVFILVFLFWKELKLYIFNESFFISLGFKKTFMDFLINTLLIVVVIIGIRIVGVILMSALLIAPAIAARLLSHRLGMNVILAALFGMVSAFFGTLVSAQVSNLSTGPMIIIVLSSIAILLLLFSPKRGLLKRSLDFYQLRRDVKLIQTLNRLISGDLPLKSNDKFIRKGWIRKENDQLVITDRTRKFLQRFDEEDVS